MGGVSLQEGRDSVEPSVKVTEVVTDSWINPTVTGLPSKRHREMGRSKGSVTKRGELAREESKKFEVAPESMSADTGSGRPGIQMRTRKETSECEVRAALIWTESTGGLGASCTSGEVCWGTTRSRLHTCEDGSRFSFPSSLGAPRLPPRWLHRARQ